MLFFYIRHGDPTYVPDALTERGKRQAEALAKRLAQFGLDRIYASTSTRAMETAMPTCELLNLKPTPLDWCREDLAREEFIIRRKEDGRKQWGFQSPELCRLFNREEVRALGNKWYEHEAFREGRFGEGMERIGREADAFFAELGYVHLPQEGGYRIDRPNEERVALFAHQGFGFAFLSHVLDIPYPLFCTHFDMGHTGMTVIQFADQGGISIPRVLQLSNDSHLWREGLPTHYHNAIRF